MVVPDPASSTPKLVDSSFGTRMAATVTPAPVATCCSTIWRGSIR